MDLSLVPIEEIFNELDKRFDTLVILTVKRRGINEIYEHHQIGGHMELVGLCEQMAFSLKQQKEIEETHGFDQD